LKTIEGPSNAQDADTIVDGEHATTATPYNNETHQKLTSLSDTWKEQAIRESLRPGTAPQGQSPAIKYPTLAINGLPLDYHRSTPNQSPYEPFQTTYRFPWEAAKSPYEGPQLQLPTISEGTTPPSLPSSLSQSPPETTVARKFKKYNRAGDPDLIRNSAIPDVFDCSADAQIIRTARSNTGIQHDWTWSKHRKLLYEAVVDARISELNTKLAKGLDARPLIRSMDETHYDEDVKSIITFAKTGMQKKIDWMWCHEHMGVLGGWDFNVTEVGPAELDTMAKRAGFWTYKPSPEDAMEVD
jgi:hypothetical protein